MYFRSFPKIDYLFGNSPRSVRFQNLGAYVDIIDQLRSRVEFYTTHYIGDDERPDTLSHRLYGTTDYYWTFFLLNDNLRISGWPFSSYRVATVANSIYPNSTLVTTEMDKIYSSFNVGQIVNLTSGDSVPIVSKNLNLGQITVKGLLDDNTGGVAILDGTVEVISIETQTPQRLAVHHYEDENGAWVDIDPSNPSLGGLIPITYQEYLEAYNEELRQIKVIKQDSIRTVVNEFHRKLAG